MDESIEGDRRRCLGRPNRLFFSLTPWDRECNRCARRIYLPEALQRIADRKPPLIDGAAQPIPCPLRLEWLRECDL